MKEGSQCAPDARMMNDEWRMMNDEWWMMNDEWWMMNEGWWMMNDEWWMMNDERWMMNDEWWMMNDEWWMMNDEWWMMNDEWWMMNDVVNRIAHRVMPPLCTHQTIENLRRFPKYMCLCKPHPGVTSQYISLQRKIYCNGICIGFWIAAKACSRKFLSLRLPPVCRFLRSTRHGCSTADSSPSSAIPGVTGGCAYTLPYYLTVLGYWW